MHKLCITLTAFASLACAQTWQPLNNQPMFHASNALQLTDGTVMVQASESRVWWRLTPDSTGDYVNGTWSQLASMPSDYNPLYYASAVLPSGVVVVNGGEYNGGDTGVETNLGAIYNPVTNTWKALAAPSGWSQIGDGQSVVLSDGSYMLGNCCTSVQAILDAATLTWTITGAGKADANSEEGWTLLPDGTVLTVDVSDTPNTERYNPTTGTWSSAGKTPVNLSEYSEMGPAILRPDGTVFATGASGNTAIYTPGAGGTVGTWAAGPVFPMVGGMQIDIADGPGALLPNGDVLLAASPGAYKTPLTFYEFDGTNLNSVLGTPNAPTDSSYYGRMLVLPTGQILFTDGSRDVEVFTGPGAPNPAWAPVISSVPKTLTPGKTYNISGVGFNGLSQGAAYGDDAQSATNYPLVRIGMAGGNVYYCRTSGFSSMAVASPATVTAHFEVPAGIPAGKGALVVVANGIASKPVPITVN